MATQPYLILIADHQLDWSKKHRPEHLFTDCSIELFMENYCHWVYQLNGHTPPVKSHFTLSYDLDGEAVCELCDINIRIQKHIIQFNFPFIYRAIVDFLPLRTAVFQLLEPMLLSIGATSCAIFPSFWNYPKEYIHNQWHHDRLLLLQEKIVRKSVSYKRTLLNLQTCMGPAQINIDDIARYNYWAWWQGIINPVDVDNI